MTFGLAALGSYVSLSNAASRFQRLERRPLCPRFIAPSISQIFARALSQKSYNLALPPLKVIESTKSHHDMINAELVSDFIDKEFAAHSPKEFLMGFEEYKHKYLPTFDQYKDKHIKFMKSDEKGSALSKLEEAHRCYTKMSYQSYRERFFPPPNSLIF